MILINILENESINDAFSRIYFNVLAYAKTSLNNIERLDYSIHEARKSFKRLRSLIRIYKYAIEDEVFQELNTLLRDAGRRLSHFRDIDAIAECLSKIEAKNKENILLIEALKIQINSFRYNNDEASIAREIENVINDIEQTEAIIKNIELPQQIKSNIKKGVRKIYNNTRTLYYKNLINENDILMHEFRKKVKQLWDVALIFNLQTKEDIDFAENIHHLSTLLGDYHDLVMTFDFVVEERLILDDENAVKFKKILYKRKEKIAQKAFHQATLFLEKTPEVFTQEFLARFIKK